MTKDQNICYCGNYGGGMHTRSARCPGGELRTPQGEPALTSHRELPGTREPVVTAPKGNAGESPASTSSNLRVKLLKDVYDDGQDHHPPGYIARKGDVVVIHSIQTAVVSHHGTGHGFVVHDGELELMRQDETTPAHCIDCIELKNALAAAVKVANEARECHDRDQDMRTMKLLIALSGHLPKWRADTDRIHDVLRRAVERLSAPMPPEEPTPDPLVTWIGPYHWRCRCKSPADVNIESATSCKDCGTMRPEKAGEPAEQLCNCGEFCNKSLGQPHAGTCRRLKQGLPVKASGERCALREMHGDRCILGPGHDGKCRFA